MINCENIQQEILDLELTFQSCTILTASQLQKMTQLLLALNTCKCDCSGTDPLPVVEITSFQFNDISQNINNIDIIDDTFLTDNGTLHTESSMLLGKNITMTKIARFGFVIKNSTENPYLIYDILNNNITDLTFDYSFDNNISYFVTKEFVTPSNIYFKFQRN